GVKAGVNSTTGSITLNADAVLKLMSDVTAAADVTFNTTAGGVGQSSGKVTGTGLRILGTGSFYLDQFNNDFTTFASDANGQIVFRDANDLAIGTVAGTKGIKTANTDVFIRTGAGFVFDGNKTTITMGTGSIEIRAGQNDGGVLTQATYPTTFIGVDTT